MNLKKFITVILKTSVQGTAVKSRETCDSVQGFQSFGLASLRPTLDVGAGQCFWVLKVSAHMGAYTTNIEKKALHYFST